jgi:hypothetical protein
MDTSSHAAVELVKGGWKHARESIKTASSQVKLYCHPGCWKYLITASNFTKQREKKEPISHLVTAGERIPLSRQIGEISKIESVIYRGVLYQRLSKMPSSSPGCLGINIFGLTA